ncbi:hypothetical protein GH714_027171 [Hevea brasiliensis]|uniref:Uncharacterized protein n=1 Tax=Hevea brasiliensis TaxID=3981 RepID=A0A6A6ML87_HEVBR|nr:hypothetical protein GH714_027171 [Hevea brasiliensis]
MAGSSISISMELFIGPRRHQPLDPDGTIPSNHLKNFEHSSISMLFLVYASFAIILDRFKPKAQLGLTQLLGAVAFGQQLFLFHLHSTDHKGLEGQYHLLLQFIIVVSVTTTLMGIGLPRSCALYNDDDHLVIRCDSQEALHRDLAKGWSTILHYQSNLKRWKKKSVFDVESQKEKKSGESKGAFIHMESTGFAAFIMERQKM